MDDDPNPQRGRKRKMVFSSQPFEKKQRKQWRPEVADGSPTGWRLLKPVGQGSHSTVFLATRSTADCNGGEFFAAKRYEENLHARRERCVLESVRSPFLMRMVAQADCKGTCITILPLLEDLPDVFSPELFERLFLHSVKGLIALHDAGFIHHDIKPDNLLWDTQHDTFVLADFTVATRADELCCGHPTHRFVAPEVLEHRQCSFAEDVYSLGVTLVELIPSSSSLPVTALVWKMIHSQRHERPTAREICARLQEVVSMKN